MTEAPVSDNAPRIVSTPAEMAALTHAPENSGRAIVLIPTMGALHAGHLGLVRRAQEIPGALVVVSIFVNPLQFAAGEDLGSYPRTLARDVDMLKNSGVDVVFAPSAEAMYPDGPRTAVHAGPAGALLEGASRPTHFSGVLTVVMKLLALTSCTHAVFGEKDYQQLLLIRQMVTDLNVNVEILSAPIARASSGLALSSRNAYLSDEETATAAALNRALIRGARHSTAEAVLESARAVLDNEPDIDIDYLELLSEDLSPHKIGANRLLVAARVGTTRLLDNIAVELVSSSS